jgi:hypothetical protein
LIGWMLQLDNSLLIGGLVWPAEPSLGTGNGLRDFAGSGHPACNRCVSRQCFGTTSIKVNL